ncbi:NACHT, LRR and PYD domains-containing protein 12-like [Cololabis saira]|uniref:NACHT, LRR and PYD domains-containing protein 12-like n=1 Tax=Cololabis saira TaxID=129043 RepID=UPI002AD4A721|nr:NACHT, LRR and PYD domains-containing protein 12-like [Cololabis saira]
MKQEELAECLLRSTFAAVCKKRLKSKLKKKSRCVFEGIVKAGNPTLLKQIYTELYITEGGTGDVNNEHEVRQIEAASRNPDRAETTIRQEDIFKLPPGRDEPIRTVMTKGVAGIGKTVLTQKFTLDWAEGKANQDIQLLLPFTFRELNVLKERKFSLVELVHHFFTETREICSFEEFQVVFIFDGLDESRLPLDFHNNQVLTDVTESTSVDVLLTNLIRGNLLPSAHLWITTRPAAANQIPPECVSMVTEVRGFTDPQKEEYFRKRFREEEQTSRIISHIKTSRSVHIMCHIPVFCWITATVLEKVLETREGGELPKTLTEMYIHFLVVQAKLKKVKYDGGAETDPHWSPESRKMVESLGKLAFEQLQKGNLIFYEPDLRECGIDVREASVYSGVFTQIFRDESSLYQDQVFCFIHLSVQEFLAALHVHLTFIKCGVNLLEKQKNTFWWFKTSAETDIYQSAVDKALQSPNGHLDLFLRFLLGLSLETNQTLLRGLLEPKQRSSQNNKETVEYIKKRISEDLSAEKSINLFHCLNELNAGSLVEEVQQFLRSGHLSTDKLSPAQWSALVFILLSSGDLEVFDLKKYSASEEVLRRLLPVVKASKKVVLSGCKLSEDICADLSSVLSSQSSSLTELDLSNNHLKDSGLKKLCPGLESPHCHLESLRLSDCNLSKNICADLSSVLSSQSSSLTELDLSNNHLQDSGLKKLCPGLESPHCHLESLRLSVCNLSENICADLSSVLSSQSSSLTELDLSNNHLQDSGLKKLCPGLESPHCHLESLRLSDCNLSENICADLSSVLSSQSSSLTELDLSNDHLQDSGLKKLCPGLESPHCHLESLRLSDCNLSEDICADLSSVLSSQSSSLTELDLSNNDLQDSGLKKLCPGLESPHCHLESLRLSGCNLSEDICADLSSVLSSQSSSLTELDLSNNHLKNSGLKKLCPGLESPHCHLESLRLSGCNLSAYICADLYSVLSSQSSSLTELDLSNNHLQDSGLKKLCPGLESPHCHLESLRLSVCNLSEDICADLSSVLSSQSSSLTELDLSNNHLQDSGLKKLRPGLESPHCHLESLRLSFCNLSEDICADLSSVLSSQSSSLTELDLSNNHLQDSGLKKLCPGVESHHCHLESLRLSGCLISEEGCASLVSALSSNPSHLRELDLSYNHPGESAVKLLFSGLEDPRWRLDTLRVEPAGQRWMTPGLRKYSCHLTIDTNTVNKNIQLSDNNRKMTCVEEDQSYPDHPDRFDYCPQLLCREVLTGPCYWEVQLRGIVEISVSYRRISRKGNFDDCRFGMNDHSWSLSCSDGGWYQVYHNNRLTSSSSSSSSSVSDRVAVYVDVPAGTLSFYSISSDRLIHLHTFNTTFTEPLYPGFGFGKKTGSSVSLC